VASFLGEHHVRLDDKSRLFLPTRWRSEFTEGLVITKGQEHCLYVFTAAAFEQISDEVSDAPITDRKSRVYSRVFHSSAFDQKPDRQGRVTVSAQLREYASLQHDCTLIGVKKRLEIWDTTAWNSFMDEQESAFADRDDQGVVAAT
jgi:MraZ protein